MLLNPLRRSHHASRRDAARHTTTAGTEASNPKAPPVHAGAEGFSHRLAKPGVSCPDTLMPNTAPWVKFQPAWMPIGNHRLPAVRQARPISRPASSVIAADVASVLSGAARCARPNSDAEANSAGQKPTIQVRPRRTKPRKMISSPTDSSRQVPSAGTNHHALLKPVMCAWPLSSAAHSARHSRPLPSTAPGAKRRRQSAQVASLPTSPIPPPAQRVSPRQASSMATLHSAPPPNSSRCWASPVEWPASQRMPAWHSAYKPTTPTAAPTHASAPNERPLVVMAQSRSASGRT